MATVAEVLQLLIALSIWLVSLMPVNFRFRPPDFEMYIGLMSQGLKWGAQTPVSWT